MDNINNTTLDILQIQKILPHRAPFLLVDRVLEYDLGNSAHGVKNVSMNEWFFAGHFPQEPIMPGVLIIEALAQLSAIAMLANKAFEEELTNTSVYFVKIDAATFRAKVLPGDCLNLYTYKIRNVGNMCFFDVAAKVDGKLAGKIVALH